MLRLYIAVSTDVWYGRLPPIGYPRFQRSPVARKVIEAGDRTPCGNDTRAASPAGVGSVREATVGVSATPAGRLIPAVVRLMLEKPPAEKKSVETASGI